MTDLKLVDPALVRILRLLGDEWGQAGVAEVAQAIVGRHGHIAATLDGEHHEAECDHVRDPEPEGEVEAGWFSVKVGRPGYDGNTTHLPADPGSGWKSKPTAGDLGLTPKDEELDAGTVTMTLSHDRFMQLINVERRVEAAAKVPWYGSPEDRLAQLRLQLWAIPIERTLKELSYNRDDA